MDLYGTPDATALSTAECLLQHFGRFRAPRQLRSDNGPHFIADVIVAKVHSLNQCSKGKTSELRV